MGIARLHTYRHCSAVRVRREPSALFMLAAIAAPLAWLIVKPPSTAEHRAGVGAASQYELRMRPS